MPPKAKELDTTTLMSCCRATLGTMSRCGLPALEGCDSVCGSATLIVGGSTPSRSARVLTAASIAPAAPSMWPTCDLVLLIGIFFSTPANSASMALGSELSLAGVPVPCALT